MAPEMSDDLEENALAAAEFLKALAHEGRLAILCHLLSGEKSVSELQKVLSIRQSAASQQLARLRLEGLIAARREGKSIYYKIDDEKVTAVIGVLHQLFCSGEDRP
ncbi:helix-turn-helix transcriptional regulator [uncultured Ruegeria sp.]|uniref:ArsR/SmtB family transcription factor n=1 Tax=uncultured Ruegeria sp. TaxID=259304 RepID=UPI002603C445|nr:metalloregulator ArsR/SmtB family transcription factor [uncultured Ruegeria sp.]